MKQRLPLQSTFKVTGEVGANRFERALRANEHPLGIIPVHNVISIVTVNDQKTHVIEHGTGFFTALEIERHTKFGNIAIKDGHNQYLSGQSLTARGTFQLGDAVSEHVASHKNATLFVPEYDVDKQTEVEIVIDLGDF